MTDKAQVQTTVDFSLHFRQGSLENNTFSVTNPHLTFATVNIDTDNINKRCMVV